jgi:hypothetical protein
MREEQEMLDALPAGAGIAAARHLASQQRGVPDPAQSDSELF